MYASLPALHNIRGAQRREVLKPEACRFGLTVPELPRLNDLVGFANVATNDADWVLQCDAGDGGGK